MFPYIQVNFEGMPSDPSLEAAIHRWVARLEGMNIGVRRAEIVVERLGRRRTAVRLRIGSADGTPRWATTSHVDAYVAVSDAFRDVWRQLRAAPVARRSPVALAG